MPTGTDHVLVQHTVWIETVAREWVTKMYGQKPERWRAEETTITAMCDAFSRLWHHDVIDPDALVAFLDKETSNA